MTVFEVTVNLQNPRGQKKKIISRRMRTVALMQDQTRTRAVDVFFKWLMPSPQCCQQSHFQGRARGRRIFRPFGEIVSTRYAIFMAPMPIPVLFQGKNQLNFPLVSTKRTTSVEDAGRTAAGSCPFNGECTIFRITGPTTACAKDETTGCSHSR